MAQPCASVAELGQRARALAVAIRNGDVPDEMIDLILAWLEVAHGRQTADQTR
jgi:hypothetical protein